MLLPILDFFKGILRLVCSRPGISGGCPWLFLIWPSLTSCSDFWPSFPSIGARVILSDPRFLRLDASSHPGAGTGSVPYLADFYSFLAQASPLPGLLWPRMQDKGSQRAVGRTSLMVQWIRLLPVRGIQVWALVWEDPTRCGAAKPMCPYNYWSPHTLEPKLCNNEKPLHHS